MRIIYTENSFNFICNFYKVVIIHCDNVPTTPQKYHPVDVTFQFISRHQSVDWIDIGTCEVRAINILQH